MSKEVTNTAFYNQVVELLRIARGKVVQTINKTMVLVYFEIGGMIVEKEQQGSDRAKYGKQLLKELSKVVTN